VTYYRCSPQHKLMHAMPVYSDRKLLHINPRHTLSVNDIDSPNETVQQTTCLGSAVGIDICQTEERML